MKSAALIQKCLKQRIPTFAFLIVRRREGNYSNKIILYFRTSGGETEQREISGSSTTYTIPGLKCGTVHNFYVNTYNAIGELSCSFFALH